MIGFGIRQETTTTGTGNLTLSSVSGYPTFNDVFGLNRRFNYSILDSAGAPLEHGIGHLSGTTTLVRDRVLATYVSGTYDNTAPAAVTLASGTKLVIGTPGPGQVIAAGPTVDAGSTTNQPHRGIPSSHFVCGDISSTGFTLSADTLYVWPYLSLVGFETTGASLRVGTGVASSNVRIGLYDLGNTGYPTVLLAETGNISSATSSSNVSGTWSGGNLFVTPGWYGIAVVGSHGPAIGAAVTNGFLPNPFGIDSTVFVAPVNYRSASHTFGALPNPYPTASNVVTAGGSVTVAMLNLVAA